MKRVLKALAMLTALSSFLLLAGCSGNIGVGLNVGVPIGNHGYMSLGTSRWY